MAKGKQSGVKKDLKSAIHSTQVRKVKKVLLSSGKQAAQIYANNNGVPMPVAPEYKGKRKPQFAPNLYQK